MASPEVIRIYRSTGKVRLEAKSIVNFAFAERLLAGQSLESDHTSRVVRFGDAENWASYAVEPNLHASGIALRPNADVIRETNRSLKQLARLLEVGISQNIPALLEQLSSKWAGGPFLAAFALLGALRRPWRGPQASRRGFALLVPGTAVLATFSTVWVYPRNFFILIPFLLVFAANGLIETARWTKASIAAAGPRWFGAAACGYRLVPGLLGVAIILYPMKGVRALYEFTEGSPAHRSASDAGLWIRQQQSRRVKIMDTSPPLSFHADADYVHFPFCSSTLAIQFIAANKVDYIVLRHGEKSVPYYDDWLTHGIPDPRAQLVHPSSGDSPSEIVIFRWHSAESQFADQRAPH
jgi:hypothetical protein